MKEHYNHTFPTEFCTRLRLQDSEIDLVKFHTAIENGVRLVRQAGTHIHRTGYAEDYLRFWAEEQLWKALWPEDAFPGEEPPKYTPWQLFTIFPIDHHPLFEESVPGDKGPDLLPKSTRNRIENKNWELAWRELELLYFGKIDEKDLSYFAKHLLVKERLDSYLLKEDLQKSKIETEKQQQTETEVTEFEVTVVQLSRMNIQARFIGELDTPMIDPIDEQNSHGHDFWMMPGSEKTKEFVKKLNGENNTCFCPAPALFSHSYGEASGLHDFESSRGHA